MILKHVFFALIWILMLCLLFEPYSPLKKWLIWINRNAKLFRERPRWMTLSAPLFCRNEGVIPTGCVQRDECASRSVRPDAEWHDKHTSHRDASCQSPRDWRNYSNSRSGFRVCVEKEREHNWVTVELSARARCALVLRLNLNDSWSMVLIKSLFYAQAMNCMTAFDYNYCRLLFFFSRLLHEWIAHSFTHSLTRVLQIYCWC